MDLVYYEKINSDVIDLLFFIVSCINMEEWKAGMKTTYISNRKARLSEGN